MQIEPIIIITIENLEQITEKIIIEVIINKMELSEIKINLTMTKTSIIMETATLIEKIKIMEIIQDLIKTNKVEIMVDLKIETDKVEIRD